MRTFGNSRMNMSHSPASDGDTMSCKRTPQTERPVLLSLRDLARASAIQPLGETIARFLKVVLGEPRLIRFDGAGRIEAFRARHCRHLFIDRAAQHRIVIVDAERAADTRQCCVAAMTSSLHLRTSNGLPV